MSAIEDKGSEVVLRVRVQPKASRDAVHVEPDGRIRIALTAPPVEGAANKALVAFVAKQLGLSKGAVALVHGDKSRDKTLLIRGLTSTEVLARLAAH